MSYNFKNLNDAVRRHMLDEIKQDIGYNHVNTDGLSDDAKLRYPEFLIAAVGSGDANSLIKSMKDAGFKLSGAAKEMIESEFNRYYMRGICLKAIEERKKVSVYQAKMVLMQRADAKSKIGRLHDPNGLLPKLRMKTNTDEALGVSNGKPSGLSIELLDS